MKKVVLFNTGLALIFVIIYSNFFTVSENTFFLHPLLVLAIFSISLYISPIKGRWVIVSLITTVLLIVYLFNLIAAIYWNESISLQFLIDNGDVLLFESKKFPIVIFALPLIVFTAIGFSYQRFFKRQSVKRKDLGILPFIGVVTLGFFYLSDTITQNANNTIWQGEPIYELLKFRSYGTAQKTEISLPDDDLLANREEDYPNIILVHADALRSDRLSIYGNIAAKTPFIDRLKNLNATWLQNSFSNCSESICGFSSVLTSSFDFIDSNNSLIDILNNLGYFTNFIGSGDLYHAGLDDFFEEKLDNFLRADLNKNYYKHDDKFIIDTLSAFPDYKNVPTFFYIRMMSSHPLGLHPEKYKAFKPTSTSLMSLFSKGSSYTEINNEHNNWAYQFDDYLSIVFGKLKDKGYLNNAILVVFGDHGDAMGEHGNYGHYRTLFGEEINVPLIFWTSDNLDLKINNDQFSSLMDVSPTLLKHLNSPVPVNFLGYPLQSTYNKKLAPLDNKRGGKGVVYQTDTGSLYKLLNSEDGTISLYDLINDPSENMNVAEKHPELKQINALKKASK